jgi:hypothetical protein
MCCRTFPAQRSKGDDRYHDWSVFHMKVGIHGQERLEDSSALQIIVFFQYLFMVDPRHFVPFWRGLPYLLKLGTCFMLILREKYIVDWLSSECSTWWKYSRCWILILLGSSFFFFHLVADLE